MSFSDEYRRPDVSRFVLEHLGVNPGPVNDLFLIKSMFCHRADGIFAAQHVFRSLVSNSFQCAVNSSREAQLIVRCSNPSDVEDLDGITFKFDDKYVRVYKIESVSVAPDEEIITNNPVPRVFHASTEGMSAVGYPRGYTDSLEDMQGHTNVYMSRSTMEALNVHEGEITGIVKVNVKYMITPDAFIYAIKVVPFKGRFKFAVDQDGSMYMKFDYLEDAQYMASRHYFFGRHMIKFYNLQSLNLILKQIDKACISPIYWRTSREEQWNIVRV